MLCVINNMENMNGDSNLVLDLLNGIADSCFQLSKL